MVDGICIELAGPTWEELRINEKLEWFEVLKADGKTLHPHSANYFKRRNIKPTHCARYKGLEFERRVHPKSLKEEFWLRGSLHVFYNDGEHNHNRFTFDSLSQVIYQLQKEFGIKPERTVIRMIEYGVNIHRLRYPVGKVIRSLIIQSGSGISIKEICHEAHFTPSQFKRVAGSHRVYKVYNKGLHQEVGEDILRIELRQFKMQKLNRKGINTLSDLLKTEILQTLNQELLKLFDTLLFADWTISKDGLSEKIRNKLSVWPSPSYWINLREETNAKTVRRELNRYETIIANYSENIKGHIRERIEKSLSEFVIQSIKCPRVTNSIGNTKDRYYNQDIYDLSVDHPVRKRERNRVSNFTRDVKKILRRGPLLFPLEDVVIVPNYIKQANEIREGTKHEILSPLGL